MKSSLLATAVGHYAGRDMLIHTQAAPVCAAVWGLYDFTLERYGPIATLIEWDVDLPPLHTLSSEAGEANCRMELAHALAG